MNKQTPTEPTICLRPPQTGDAEILFPFIYQTQVIETLVWDGPESLSEYRKGLQVRREATLQGREHYFVIVNPPPTYPSARPVYGRNLRGIQRISGSGSGSLFTVKGMGPR